MATLQSFVLTVPLTLGLSLALIPLWPFNPTLLLAILAGALLLDRPLAALLGLAALLRLCTPLIFCTSFAAASLLLYSGCLQQVPALALAQACHAHYASIGQVAEATLLFSHEALGLLLKETRAACAHWLPAATDLPPLLAAGAKAGGHVAPRATPPGGEAEGSDVAAGGSD